VFAHTRRMVDVDRCDLLFFPGGFASTVVINDEAFMAEVRRLAATATYLTSVCTGSLILGAAGLLRRKQAACHWAWRGMLEMFGAIPDPRRVVRDGNIITGGGVTAGLDFALVVAAELGGEALAQRLQLEIEYAAAPPYKAGRPETAPPEIVAEVRALLAERLPERMAQAKAAAARMRSVAAE
jgi:cyclohexyl-isocyanide hydratase